MTKTQDNTAVVDTDGDGTPDGAEDYDGDGLDNASESNADLGTQTIVTRW